MSAAVLKFPAVRRLVDPSPRVPPLWQQVLLLHRAKEHDPARFDNLDRAILALADRVAQQGEDAPIDKQIECLRYCGNLMRKHCVSIPAPYYVEPETVRP